MEKKEYLNIRFKQDFLRYSLLQEDSLSAKEIADKLFAEVKLNEFANKFKFVISDLLEKHLSFDKVKVNGELSNKLSADLEFGLHDKIIAEFQSCQDNSDVAEFSSDILKTVLHSIEKQAWSNGITEMDTAIHLFVECLNNAARSYEKALSVEMEESELASKYKEAKENTFIERIQSNNIDDIIEYRNTLRKYVEVKCENMLYTTIASILHSLASEDIFNQLQENFKNLQQYAHQLKNSLPELIPNVEWDAEYNKLVPTDFYYRNVEGITAEHAFHMILFQFFARNEEWMKEQGMLVDGELRVYASCNVDLVNTLLTKIVWRLYVIHDERKHHTR